MDTRLSESDAVARARGGDSAAFAELVRAHQEATFRAAYLIVRDAAAAEDIAQEAFLRAYRGLASFRQGESFRPWLLRIATNLALNEQRARGRRLGLLQRAATLVSREAPTPPPAEALQTGDNAAIVWQAVSRLRQDDRLVIYLRFFLDLDEREMSRVMDRPAGTVKSRLHRASRRLRELIEANYPELRDRHD